MILLITRKYPPAVGGMETLSYQYTRHMARRRACRVLSPHGVWSASAPFILYALAKAAWLLLRGDIELVHLGDPILAPLGRFFLRAFHVPVACNAHGLDIVYPNRFYQVLVLGSLRRLSLVICISGYAREECLRRGVPADRCVVIPPGVEVEDWVAAEGAEVDAECPPSALPTPHVLLTVGRMVRRKGVLDLVRHVLPLVLSVRRDWVYWVVGDGPDRDLVLSECHRLGLDDHVRLLGHLGRKELWRAYAQADVFIMPNIPVEGDAEGFGIVVLEARAAGLPVIATDLEGIRDAHAGADGALIAAHDHERLAEAIVEHLAKSTDAERQRRRQQVGESFGWATIVDRYLEAFDGLALSQAGARRRRRAPRHGAAAHL